MRVRILELPLDYGSGRRGSDMGPSAMRLAGLKQALIDAGHKPEELSPSIPVTPMEFCEEGNPRVRYLAPIAEACVALAERVEAAMDDGVFPLVLGGDHSIAIGTFAGLGAAFRRRGLRWGTLWVDAHGDFNTPETTPSGNIHGMGLAVACGYGAPELTGLYGAYRKLDPASVCLIGVRDLDSGEKLTMREAGLSIYTMTEIDRLGFSETLRRIIAFFKQRVDALHVSIDMDVMDPMFAPGVGIPLPGGFSYREVLFLAEELAASGLLASAEIVEVNPVLDIRNQTAHMAVEIAARLLGATIY